MVFFGAVIGIALHHKFEFVLISFFIVGGVSYPLYSVVIAYTNDYLDHEKMSSAAGGLVFMSGLGGVFVPVITGELMTVFGPVSLLCIISFSFIIIVGYGVYRSTRRSILDVELSTAHIAIMPQATNIAVEISQEVAIEESLNS